MELTELEQHILAYYLVRGASDFYMDPRYWPPLELSHIVEDKVRFAVRWFEIGNAAAVDNAARAFLASMIEQRAFTTSDSRFGPMYQFQHTVYQTCVAEARASNPIIAQAAATGQDFWQQRFASLKG
jgi:hypothetical protein